MPTLTDVSMRRNVASASTEEHTEPAQRAVEPTVPAPTKIAEPALVIDLSLWKSATGSSGYLGVSKTASGRFLSKPWFNHDRPYLGTYDTADEAATVVAQFMIAKGKSRPATDKTFAAKHSESRAARNSIDMTKSVIDLPRWKSNTSGTGYWGVYKQVKGRFQSMPYFNGKNHSLGAYDTGEEAATVVARFLTANGKSPPAKDKAPAVKQSKLHATPTSVDVTELRRELSTVQAEDEALRTKLEELTAAAAATEKAYKLQKHKLEVLQQQLSAAVALTEEKDKGEVPEGFVAEDTIGSAGSAAQRVKQGHVKCCSRAAAPLLSKCSKRGVRL